MTTQARARAERWDPATYEASGAGAGRPMSWIGRATTTRARSSTC